jgi:hypothetical protein
MIIVNQDLIQLLFLQFNLSMNFKNLKLTAIITAISVFVFGIIARVIGLFYYTQFLGDQVRDQGVYIGISQGKLPFLGPESSIGGYSIPPLYYYISNIFGFWNPYNPNLAIVSNTIFSILTIPLGAYLVFLMLPKLEINKRFIASGIFSVIWSVFYLDIIHNSQEWNPSSLNFFFFAFVIIFHLIFQNNLSKSKNKVLWVLQGINLAILISLHSSALFVFPPIFLVLVIIYLSKNFKLWYLPSVSILTFLISLSPYWIGEFRSNFLNSKTILDTIFNKNKQPVGILDKLQKLFEDIGRFGDQAYFHTINQVNIFWFVMLISILLISFRFKILKNSAILIYFFCCFIFFLALSNYDGFVYQHYMVIVWSLGLVLPIIAISTEQKNKFLTIFKFPIYLFFISVFLLNTNATINLLKTKASSQRIPNTKDFAQIISILPNNSKLCSEENQVPVFAFFAKSQSKDIKVSIADRDCRFQYYSKFKPNQKPNSIPKENNNNIFFETETVLILMRK